MVCFIAPGKLKSGRSSPHRASIWAREGALPFSQCGPRTSWPDIILTGSTLLRQLLQKEYHWVENRNDFLDNALKMKKNDDCAQAGGCASQQTRKTCARKKEHACPNLAGEDVNAQVPHGLALKSKRSSTRAEQIIERRARNNEPTGGDHAKFTRRSLVASSAEVCVSIIRDGKNMQMYR